MNPYGSDPRFVSPERRAELLRERFVPWPLAKLPESQPRQPGCPIAEWGSTCARGFVGNERFATHGEQVIPRTNRNVTRKWLALGERKA